MLLPQLKRSSFLQPCLMRQAVHPFSSCDILDVPLSFCVLFGARRPDASSPPARSGPARSTACCLPRPGHCTAAHLAFRCAGLSAAQSHCWLTGRPQPSKPEFFHMSACSARSFSHPGRRHVTVFSVVAKDWTFPCIPLQPYLTNFRPTSRSAVVESAGLAEEQNLNSSKYHKQLFALSSGNEKLCWF